MRKELREARGIIAEMARENVEELKNTLRYETRTAVAFGLLVAAMAAAMITMGGV